MTSPSTEAGLTGSGRIRRAIAAIPVVRVAAITLAAGIVHFSHWPPRWMSAIPMLDLPAELPRQTGGYALLTLLLALARPLGRMRQWHVHGIAAAMLAAGLVYALQWTLPLAGARVDPADAPRQVAGILLALAGWMRCAPASERPVAAVWFWRGALVVILPPSLMMALMPGYGDRLSVFVPGWSWLTVRDDHWGHALGALVIGLCVMRSRLCGLSRPWIGIHAGLVITLLAGPVLESVQGMVGRGQELGDVIAHSVGTMIAWITVLAATQVTKIRRNAGAGDDQAESR